MVQLGYKVISQQIIQMDIFKNINDEALQVGTFTGSLLRYVTPGTLLKFSAPAGKHFMADDSLTLMTGNADPQAVLYKWAKVVSIATDGTTVTNGIGLLC